VGGAHGHFEAPRQLQSWPGIVHGGCLVALVDDASARLGGVTGRRRIDGRLTSSVPTETALALRAERGDGGLGVTILQAGHTLTSGSVVDLPATPAVANQWTGGGDGTSLPMSEHCLACGADNPLGLRATLSFDGEGVWVRLTPPAPWRVAGDRLHPALAPVLLDEVSWWLGALVMKQGGLTNRLAVSLHDPAAPFGPLVAAGRFAEVTPVDRKRTFWRTETTLRAASGALIASASIIFRGGAEYSERQIPYFRSRTSPDVFRRMFPDYV
jgi:hypothetical protein